MSEKKVKKKFLTKESVWLMLFSYVLVILFTRIILYYNNFVFHAFAGVMIKGIHLHHYFWGHLIMLFGSFLYLRNYKFVSFILIGVGLGQVFDEIYMMIWNDLPSDLAYWSLWNMVPITAGLLILSTLFFLVKGRHGNQPETFRLTSLTEHWDGLAHLIQKVLFSKVGLVKKKAGDEYFRVTFGYVFSLLTFLGMIFFILTVANAKIIEEGVGGYKNNILQFFD